MPSKIPPFSMLLLNQPCNFDVHQDLEPPIYLIFGGSTSNLLGAIGHPKNIHEGTYTYMYINKHCRYYTELAKRKFHLKLIGRNWSFQKYTQGDLHVYIHINRHCKCCFTENCCLWLHFKTQTLLLFTLKSRDGG